MRAAVRPPLSPETRAKIGAANRGRRHGPVSAETREKIAASKRGRKLSAEQKAKLVAANRSRTLTEETRAKMRAAKLGRKRGPPSDETKAKIAAALREYRARTKAVPEEGIAMT
jgi:hypothetical protein